MTDERSEQLKFAQDHPVPMEYRGYEDERISQILTNIKHKEFDHVEDFERAFREMSESIELLHNDNSKYNAFRLNIETLWTRVKTLIDSQEAYTGATTTSSSSQDAAIPVPVTPSTPSSPSTSSDEEFFAYDSGVIVVTSAQTALTLDTEVLNDSYYSFTAGGSEITILSTSEFEIDADVSLKIHKGDIIEVNLQRDVGAGFVDIPGSFVHTSG